ncbi:MAG: hypothetical protein JKY25_10545 [Robiginitomaculum sp.]|nr:hypothetical protein [Robiginitomaculum sp.]
MARFPDQRDLGGRRPIVSVGGVVSGPRGTGSVGAGVSNVGKDIELYFSEEKRKDDAVQSDSAVNKLRRKALELSNGDDGYSQKRSGQVVSGDFYKDYSQRFSLAADEIGATLTNNEQREAFRQERELHQLNFDGSLTNHLVKERAVHAGQVYEGGKALELEGAALGWSNPNVIGTAIERTRKLERDNSERLGIAPAQARATELDSISDIHTSVIENALSNKSNGYAKTYLDTHNKEISDINRTRLTGAVNIGQDLDRQRELTDGILVRNRDIKGALAEAKKIQNTKDRDVVVGRIKSEFSDRDAIEAEAHDEIFDSAIDITREGGFSEIPANVIAELTPKELSIVKGFHRGSRERVEPVNDDRLYVDFLSLTPAEVQKIPKSVLFSTYYDSLDDSHWSSVINEWDTVREAGSSRSSKQKSNFSFKETINTVAISAGYLSGDETPSNIEGEKKKQYADITLSIDSKLRALVARGIEITPDIEIDIVTKAFTNTALVGGGFFSSKESVPVSALTDDQLDTASVLVNGQEVRLSSIPRNDRQSIIQSLESQGHSVTEQAIAETYLDVQRLMKRRVRPSLDISRLKDDVPSFEAGL